MGKNPKKLTMLGALIAIGESIEEEAPVRPHRYARWRQDVYYYTITHLGLSSEELTLIDDAFWRGEYVHADPPTVPPPNRERGAHAAVAVLKTFKKGHHDPSS